MMTKLIAFAKKWTLLLGMLGGLHLPFAGNFHRAQQLHTFSEYRQLVAAVAKRKRTPVKNKENRLCNTEL
jgi:hypothetical protein